LKRREPLQQGVQRLSLEHLDYAINALAGGALSPDTTVHEARKALRRVRGLLRLVRDELGKDVYRVENIQLRDTGRLLSEARSAAVAIETLKALEGRFAKVLADDVFADLHVALEARRFSAVERAVGNVGHRRNLIRTLRSIRARHAALPLEGTLGRPSSTPSIRNSYEAIAPGLARVYERGRRGMAHAYRAPSADSFHEWRKRARYLRFQLETLTGMWPEVLEGVTSTVDDLGETLGDEHDLADLARIINTELSVKKRKQELLNALIEQRRRGLQLRARTRGLLVYAEPTDQFVERLGVYWEAWRT
jgi:CHAD domain-containing protein